MRRTPSPGSLKSLKRHRGKEYPFYPNHLLRVLIVLALTGALISLAGALAPPTVEEPADPLSTPDPGVRTLWFLKPVVLMDRLLPGTGGEAILLALAGLLFALVPLLERPLGGSGAGRTALSFMFLLWIAFLVVSILLTAPGGPP